MEVGKEEEGKLEVGEIDLISEVNVGRTIAFFCVVLACLLSFHLIYKHLRHYTRPELQKHIVRILLMVPIYAIDSFLSLLFPHSSLYFDLLRDSYEAYVVYTFFRLLLSFLYSSLPSPSSLPPPSSPSSPSHSSPSHSKKKRSGGGSGKGDSKDSKDNNDNNDIPLSIIPFDDNNDIHAIDIDDAHHHHHHHHYSNNSNNSNDIEMEYPIEHPSNDRDDHEDGDGDGGRGEDNKREEDIKRKRREQMERRRGGGGTTTTMGRRKGGEEEDKVVEIMEGKGKRKHMIPLCCLPPFTPGRSFFILCKRLIYQFVLIKPLLALLSLLLLYLDLYGEGEYDLTKGYLYITLIDNLSVTVAMYCLVLFYYTMKEELEEFKPIPKFICIKSIILFTFWQGIAIGVAAYMGIISGDVERGWSEENVTTGLQDFLICFEMFLLSLLHLYSFPVGEYKRERVEGWRDLIPCCSFCFDVFCCCCCCFSLLRNFINVISQRDVIEDGWATFNLPTSFSSLSSSLSSPFKSRRSNNIINGDDDEGDDEGDHPLDDDHPPVHLSDDLLPLPPLTMID